MTDGEARRPTRARSLVLAIGWLSVLAVLRVAVLVLSEGGDSDLAILRFVGLPGSAPSSECVTV